MMRASLKLRPRFDQLSTLNEWVDSLELDDRIDKSKLQLICEEVFINIVSHAYPGLTVSEEEGIELEIAFVDKKLSLRFTDSGREYEPEQIPHPNIDEALEDRQIGGLGWYFIRYYLDKIEYQRLDNKNVLYLAKQF